MALILVVLTLTTGGLAVLAAVRAGHRAAAAADLAALAAASALAVQDDGSRACREADRVATANGAVLTACRVRGPEVEVSAAVTPGWRGLPDATARSRAGPGPH